MLVLTRKTGEFIDIVCQDGTHIEVVLVGLRCRDGKAKIGVRAPKEVSVHRREVSEAIKRDGQTPRSKKDE